MHAEVSKIPVINDNDTLYHLYFGLCVKSSVIVLVPRYFSSEKYRGPKQSPLISDNGPKKDGLQLLLSK